MTHGERSTNREYTAPYVRLKGGQEMRFSGWNRHFKKTDPSIHRETIKLIARHHASNWRCSVPLRAVPRRAACFFFGAVLSLAWKKFFLWNVNDNHRCPDNFFFKQQLIWSYRRVGLSRRRRETTYLYVCIYSILFCFHCFRAKEIKSACSYTMLYFRIILECDDRRRDVIFQ